eukprot:CAMPEP_0201488902 /NCGR_PEP_ID=MMETSP0151_2-20130828/20194_1 /ASSEMBLY_ACC=CAM_ASM_000257 /TAXON_ID=200890 /ORGANISM="Paramoeba atlantica, Strain 621/1 / CCAP 1560/9" /LENGTH=58 /DNA_ID=CAMNT_0047874315 /DNA_START=281 /DNA_END=454 /DNA_ORIENTATION=-
MTNHFQLKESDRTIKNFMKNTRESMIAVLTFLLEQVQFIALRGIGKHIVGVSMGCNFE